MKSYSLRILLFTILTGLACASTPSAATPATGNKPAAAQAEAKLSEVHEKFKRCAGLRELSIRLGCYDEYAIELGYITPDRAKADIVKISEIGVWQVSTKDNGQGTVHTYLRTDSVNTIAQNNIDRQVSLVIRCLPGKTEAFLDWKGPVVTGGQAIHNKPTTVVNYSTNNNETFSEEWDVSTDQRALFARDPVAFVRNLMNKQTLSISFIPRGMYAETARFSIDGIEKAVDEIVKACYADGTGAPK